MVRPLCSIATSSSSSLSSCRIHAGTLSPPLFEQYHLPTCRHRCERLHAAGKFVHSHWDGDCGPLLRYARDTGLDGIEAITPKPQGDVTLEEVKEALGDDLFLLDGIPAVYFDETFSIQTLVECVQTLIELFAPKLVLGISDEISSTGDIERIRAVLKTRALMRRMTAVNRARYLGLRAFSGVPAREDLDLLAAARDVPPRSDLPLRGLLCPATRSATIRIVNRIRSPHVPAHGDERNTHQQSGSPEHAAQPQPLADQIDGPADGASQNDVNGTSIDLLMNQVSTDDDGDDQTQQP